MGLDTTESRIKDTVAKLGIRAPYGVVSHRGVIVVWDEDRDQRLLAVLDNLPADVLDQLIAVHEHEATLNMYWGQAIPPNVPKEIKVQGDSWMMVHNEGNR